MRNKKKIIRLRTRQPLLTGSEISRKLNVSKQYVHQVLKKAGLNNRQPHYKKRIIFCKVCGNMTTDNICKWHGPRRHCPRITHINT